MAEEEQPQEENQEQNAEAGEAVEAGAEAAEEATVQEPKAPNVLVPMLLSAVITVVGVGVMVAVILPKQIEKAIAAASHDTNASAAHGDDSHGDDSHGDDSHGGDSHGDDSHGDDSHGGEAEAAGPGAEPFDPKKPQPIVPEGENIVINPARSQGQRYLLVEIHLLPGNDKDTGFPKAVKDHTKQLQALTVDYLSAEDTEALSNPATKERLKHRLKLAYEDKLGSLHPIREIIVSKWIMQ